MSSARRQAYQFVDCGPHSSLTDRVARPTVIAAARLT
jgi:hypothetical protein